MSQAKIPKAPKTPEERRAQMHDVLYGAPGKDSTPLSSGAVGERLLLGLTLHAARRQAQGKTLSDFESRLCKTFRTVIEDADEAAQPNYQIVDLTNTTPSESESGGVAEILSAHALERRVSGNPITLSLQGIYWATAAGSDGNGKYHQVTREYGSVDSRKSGYFDSDETTLFSGPVFETLGCDIECWEVDDSSSSWLSGLRGAMRDMGDFCIDAASQSEEQDRATAVIALVGIAAKAIDALLDLITNDDDFVERRSIGWDLPALRVFYASQP